MTRLSRRHLNHALTAGVVGLAAFALTRGTARADTRIRFFWWGNPERDKRTLAVGLTLTTAFAYALFYVLPAHNFALLLVVNAVGENRAFEVDNNDGWLLASDGTESALEHGSKTLMASRIVDAIVAFLHSSGG